MHLFEQFQLPAVASEAQTFLPCFERAIYFKRDIPG